MTGHVAWAGSADGAVRRASHSPALDDTISIKVPPGTQPGATPPRRFRPLKYQRLEGTNAPFACYAPGAGLGYAGMAAGAGHL